MDYNEVFTVAFESLKAQQVRSEFERFIKMMLERKPKRMIEIGTATGGTLYLFARILDPDLIVSIDKPYDFKNYSSTDEMFTSFGRNVHIIRSDSHNERTLNMVKNIIGNEPVDFLFIDGDHSYEGVKKDFEMYSPLVKRGGIIAFHDICIHSPDSDVYVKDYWLELKPKYKCTEYIRSDDEEDEKLYKEPNYDSKVDIAIKGASGFSYGVQLPKPIVEEEKNSCSFVVYRHHESALGIGVIEVE